MNYREKLVELRALINSCAASKHPVRIDGVEVMKDQYLVPRGSFDELVQAAEHPTYETS